jgi:lysozyme
MIPGINVSHWQREIDWSEVKRSGVKFAFLKATEFPEKRTILKIDDQLQKNIEGASSNNIYWGAYHYFRTHIDPVIQAKLFCQAVGNFSSLPAVLDLEVAGTRGERLNYKVRLFLDEVEKISGRKPIIFTSEGFWRSYMCAEKSSHADWARDYSLWTAQFTSLWPTAMYPWAGWDFWQYTDKGKIPGIQTTVDMNWFNGSEQDLAARFVDTQGEYSAMDRGTESEPDFISANEQAKSFNASDSIEDFKGDFQEPINQFRRTHSPRSEMRPIHEKIMMQNENSFNEEDWIREYFLQSA